MHSALRSIPGAGKPDPLHTGFMAFVPRIERRARLAFRNLHCRATLDDAIAEAVALVWCWFIRLMQRGKDPTRFILRLATYATWRGRTHRRLCGQERAKDIMSPVAQARYRFVVGLLPVGSSLSGNIYDEALRDNTQTPPAEQAAFRLDFPQWRKRRCERDRRILDDLMLGERTQDVARRYGLSEARISQLRRDLRDDWAAFCGESA